jgi:hypothetical protein
MAMKTCHPKVLKVEPQGTSVLPWRLFYLEGDPRISPESSLNRCSRGYVNKPKQATFNLQEL